MQSSIVHPRFRVLTLGTGMRHRIGAIARRHICEKDLAANERSQHEFCGLCVERETPVIAESGGFGCCQK
jgi:hypothetical protein